jgi:nitrate/TMAO reductase-like tetraheme cytochrome c subunit
MQWLASLVALGLLAGAVGWGVSDRLEQRNDFCVSCHLPDGAVLHAETRENFDRVVPVNLAGVHGRGWVEEREDSAFRCIDCHAGSGAFERTKIKLLAAKDALRYAVGAFEEPEGMPFDLSRKTCLGCHPTFRRSAAPGWTVQAYHGLGAHDAAEEPRCVACHAVHEEDGDAFAYYMARPRVVAQCRVCHGEDDGVELPALQAGPFGAAGLLAR